MVQNIQLETSGQLRPDFSLQAVDFRIRSGRFSFAARGQVANGVLELVTASDGSDRRHRIPLPARPYLAAGLLDALHAAGLQPKTVARFDIFDPVTLAPQPVTISVVGTEQVQAMGEIHPATKVMLSFKGTTQFAWLSGDGEVLQEKGLLGIRLEKTSRREALADSGGAPPDDLAELAAVPSNVVIRQPESLRQITVAVSGIDLAQVHLDGGRQTRRGNRVTVVREDLGRLPPAPGSGRMGMLETAFLQPSPLIQSDHPSIRDLVAAVLAGETGPPLRRAERLLAWVHENIEKRPVLSLPDALSTLANRQGDCNEHAVLLTAMARAAGIPARIETGLVHLNGRFYYHAWNLLYLGAWVTADAVYNQMPADVTHIRFASGTRQQADLMGVFGRVRLEVLDVQPPEAGG